MRCLLVLLVLVLVAPRVNADDPQDGAKDGPGDGLYAFTYADAEAGTGRRGQRLDGATIVLGKRLTTEFGEARIVSVANDNSRFHLTLPAAGPFPRGADEGYIAVVVAGHTVGIWSNSEPTPTGHMEVAGTIDGRDAAVAIAQRLETTIAFREHPGHRVVVSLRPEKTAYAVGEPVTVVLRIENVGRTTFTFIDGGQQRGPRNNQFGFTAFSGGGSGKGLPDVGDPTNFGGIGGFVELKPGGVFEKSVGLDKWFRFEKPDDYQVTAIYEMRLEEGAGWDDFAVGRCNVRIEGR